MATFFCSLPVYQHVFFFGHDRCYYHFVQRVDWIYHFCRLKNKTKLNRIPYERFVLNVFSVLNYRQSLFNNFFNLITQTQTESSTDRLNVPTNVLNVPTDLVRTKRWGGGNCPLSPLLGYANDARRFYSSRGRAPALKELSPGLFTLCRRRKTSIILLWLTSDHFTRHGESSRLERVVMKYIFH